MHINVNVILDPGDNFTMTPDDVASNVLTVLNGDPAKDIVMSSIRAQPETGSAGAITTEPPPDYVPTVATTQQPES